MLAVIIVMVRVGGPTPVGGLPRAATIFFIRYLCSGSYPARPGLGAVGRSADTISRLVLFLLEQPAFPSALVSYRRGGTPGRRQSPDTEALGWNSGGGAETAFPTPQKGLNLAVLRESREGPRRPGVSAAHSGTLEPLPG